MRIIFLAHQTNTLSSHGKERERKLERERQGGERKRKRRKEERKERGREGRKEALFSQAVS